MIDLITNLDMSAFHSLGGWSKMLDRLEMEVTHCRKEVPFVLSTTVVPASTAVVTASSSSSSSHGQVVSGDDTSNAGTMTTGVTMETSTVEDDRPVAMDTNEENTGASSSVTMATCDDHTPLVSTQTLSSSKPCSTGVLYTCMPERAALIKSILNFLKKAIPEPTFSENMRTCKHRHVVKMTFNLPQ